MSLAFIRFITAGAALLAAMPSLAQTWPAKPIRILVETAAGSVFDTALRAVMQQLGQQLGQQVLLDNRPGANGVVAMEACAKAAPDGYTGCDAATNSFSYNPHVFRKLSYDPDRDFKPVSNLVVTIDALVVSSALPAKTLKELQALASSKPGGLDFGTLGEGSNPDVFRQLLAEQWKVKLVGIPYKGGSNVTAVGLMSGEIDMSKGSLGSWIAGINGGKIRLLAVGASKRLAKFPDVPTFAEAGLPEAGRVFMGLVMPAGTPDAIINRLNAEIAKALAEPKVREAIANRYMEPDPMAVAEFAAFLKHDRQLNGELIRKFHVPHQ